MRWLKYLKPGRVSTGLTVFVSCGFLVNAILTDNGGSATSQAEWRAAKAGSKLVIQADGREIRKLHRNDPWVDPIITGSAPARLSTTKNRKTVDKQVSVLSIIARNNDTLPARVSRVGRASVQVQSGDTLFSIGQRHGLGVAELARLNGLIEPYTIKVGQTLYIIR